MVVYSYALDQLVRCSDYVPYAIGPGVDYKEGHVYWCTYWQRGYTVLSNDLANRGVVHVRWFDGGETWHMTLLDPRDYELKHCPNLKPVIGKTYTFAEIRAMLVRCPEFKREASGILHKYNKAMDNKRYKLLYDEKSHSWYVKCCKKHHSVRSRKDKIW